MSLHPHPNRELRRTPPTVLRPSSASLALSLPLALTETESKRLESAVTNVLRLKRAEPLFRPGEAFRSVFVIRSGSFMTSVLSADGREQVTGFPMAGELLGLDAISLEHYASGALALEDSMLYEIPFDSLMTAATSVPGLQIKLFRLMSREIVKDQGVMMLLGNMNSDERLAAFLLNLSRSYEGRGFSGKQFQLRMRREDIGSYLGVQLETVSRTLSKFQAQGLIRVYMREIELLDLPRLQAIVEGAAAKGLH